MQDILEDDDVINHSAFKAYTSRVNVSDTLNECMNVKINKH